MSIRDNKNLGTLLVALWWKLALLRPTTNPRSVGDQHTKWSCLPGIQRGWRTQYARQTRRRVHIAK